MVVSGSKTVNANSTAYIDTTITRSGYTALGIVGLSGSGTGNFAFQDNSLVSSNTVARVYVRNLTSATATISSLNIYILYVKN